MVQWSIGYVALAYSVQQGVGLTSEAFEWPQVVLRISMLLLALGLPVVVTIAWYHGDRGSQRVSGPEMTIISICWSWARCCSSCSCGRRKTTGDRGGE